ncbi:hypothetical protein ACIOGZ_04000 [Kitasatospora sp. NPDC088160]|uniref:hypothetical protein n=1 Tax=Kitasatospora sp. NPDC088160 TaxID=3364072 RepID=UPI0037F5C5FE
MGRHTNPVPAGTGPRLRALALALRRLKEAGGLTYAELAEHTKALGMPKGAATLSQAAGGHRLPRLGTIVAFARAAADPADAKAQREAAVQGIRDLWKAAAIERAAPLASEQAPTAQRYRRVREVGGPVVVRIRNPHPRRTLANLALGLRKMRARAGQPSLKAIQDLSDAAGNRVAKSTIQLILAGRVLPTHNQLVAVLDAFDHAAGPGRAASHSRRSRWIAVRDSIERRRRRATVSPQLAFGCLDSFVLEVRERREREEEILRKVGKLSKDGEAISDDVDDEYRLGVPDQSPTSLWLLNDEEVAAWAHEALESGRYEDDRDLRAELRALADG